MPYANTEAMNVFIKTLSEQQKEERIVLCMDKAAWHTTKQLQIPANVVVWFLPPYSPELNPVELIWRELRGKYFNNRTFNSLNEVDTHLEFAINDYTRNTSKIKKLTEFSISYY